MPWKISKSIIISQSHLSKKIKSLSFYYKNGDEYEELTDNWSLLEQKIAYESTIYATKKKQEKKKERRETVFSGIQLKENTKKELYQFMQKLNSEGLSINVLNKLLDAVKEKLPWFDYFLQIDGLEIFCNKWSDFNSSLFRLGGDNEIVEKIIDFLYSALNNSIGFLKRNFFFFSILLFLFYFHFIFFCFNFYFNFYFNFFVVYFFFFTVCQNVVMLRKITQQIKDVNEKQQIQILEILTIAVTATEESRR